MAACTDAHTHVFPPEFIRDRIALAAAEPVFGGMYGAPGARMVDADELLADMDAAGVARAILCGFSWHDPGRARAHNDYILAAARRGADRLLPLAAVDPLAPGAVREAERALAAGAAGLGEVGAYGHDLAEPDVRRGLDALADLAAAADRPLMLHVNEPVGHRYPGKAPMGLAGLYDLVAAHPQVRFQLAHLGGGLPLFCLLKKEICGVLARCVYDTAAAPYLYKPEVYRVVLEHAGPDKLLFGTDYPLIGWQRGMAEIARSGLDAAATAAVLGGNARAFWNW